MKRYTTRQFTDVIPPGLYKCKGSFRSVPWITTLPEFDMTDDELIEWMENETPYELLIIEETTHGNGD